jgi:UDP-N-acetylglucosamine--N-acetylmuramyl-(pentapeptide) pyrophosphoryl-undecaprenol N-acetylglucosamine transferase
MKKILISTGGSGGHVIPATILFDHYKENFETYLTTDKRGEKYIDQNKYIYDVIDVPKFSRNIFKLPLILIYFLFSFFKSLIYLKKNGIEYLFSTGGYMSAVFCIAAKISNIKIFLYEPNMVLGRSNK